MAGKIKGIIIEFGGDTTKLESALKDINKNARDLDSQLRQVNNSLKFNPGNSDLIAQKQRILKESIENTKNKLDALKQAQIQVENEFKNGNIGVEEYEKLQREILKTENQLKNLERQQGEINNSFKSFGENLDKIGKKTTEVGTTLTKGVTAPILALGAGSVKAFNEVDDGLDTIIKKTGATGDAAKGLEQAFNNVYSSFPAEAGTVGNVIGEINTQFGLLGKELENKSILMLKFAEINNQDVTTSTIQAKQAIEAFNLGVKDFDTVLDSVTKTGQNTGVSVDKLFDSVIKGAPALQGLGLGFSESVAIMGNFEQSGIDSSKAISYLTKAQTNWAKEGKSMQAGLMELSGAIKNAKNEQEGIALASEVFGTKAAPMMAKAIKDGKLSFDEFSNSANLAKGAVNGTFEETKDPVDDFVTAMNNLKLIGAEIAIQLQETLAPIIQEVIKKLKEFSEWFKSLNPETKELLVKIALIAAAVGPILILIGSLISGIAGFVANLVTIAPAIGGIVGAISTALPVILALGMAFLVGKIIKDHWNEIASFFNGILQNIKNFFVNIWNSIKEIVTVVCLAKKQAIENTWNAIKTFCETIWNSLKSFFTNIWNGIKSVFTNTLNGIKNIVQSVWGGIRDFTSNIWNGIKTQISNLLNSIKTTFSNIFNGFKSIVVDSFNNIKGSISQGLSNAVRVVFDFAGRFFDAGRNIIGSIADGIRSAFSWVTDAIGDITSAIREYLPFSPAKRGALRDLNKLNFGGTISEGILNGKDAVRSAMDNLLHIPKLQFDGVYNNLNSEDYKNNDPQQLIFHIENMNVSDKDKPREIAEELFTLTKRDKRGRGL